MTLAHPALDAVRVAVLLGLALAAMPLLRRAPSAARRLVLALAFGGALALPAVAALAPAWRVEAPAAVSPLRGRPVLEPLEGGAATGSPARGDGLDRAPVRAALPSGPGWPALVVALVVALWAAGALLVTARLLVGLARARAMVRRAAPAPAWDAAVARAERVTGLRAEVRATGELDAPAVTGVFAPVVLVPRASDGWSDARRCAVLLHELAHVRRADCFVQIVAALACAAHWFDPLAWIALRRLRIERELAADDAVIAAGTRASSYAEDLLAIAGAGGPSRGGALAALGMAEPSELSARVAALVAPGRPRRPLSRAGAALLSAGAALVLLAVACATPAGREPAARGAASGAAGGAAGGASPVARPAVASAAPLAAGTTIDPGLQAIADEELTRAVSTWEAVAGAVVVLDPATGEILANAGRAGGVPAEVGLRAAYVTGSTLKAVTLAAALEEGVVAPADRFDCENGAFTYAGRPMRDAGAYGALTVPEMLAVSTNIGFAKVFDRLGGARLGRWLRAFHFGAAPAIDGATGGHLSERIEDGSYEGAMIAIGQSMTASPVQIAAAYAALANDGVYVAPTLVRGGAAAAREQVVSAKTARAVVAMLEGAVNGERATGRKAQIAGARVAGKTGTAEWELPGGGEGTYSSFVGLVPAGRPRFVILVGIEGPRGGAASGGGTVAAPVFARVAAHALAR